MQVSLNFHGIMFLCAQRNIIPSKWFSVYVFMVLHLYISMPLTSNPQHKLNVQPDHDKQVLNVQGEFPQYLKCI